MKVLLTGYKGWVGGKLYKKLLEDPQNEVYGLDEMTYEDFETSLDYLTCQVSHFDYVIHCGAIADSRREDNLLWEMNYKATCEIGRMCQRTNSKLIFISSCAAIDPQIPYGWSKHCSEVFLQNGTRGMPLCILRPFNIWGFDEENKESPSIVYKMINGQLRFVYKDVVRDFIYVDDVVDAILSVFSQWTPGVFELGTAVPTNIEDLFCKVWDRDFLIPAYTELVEKEDITKELVAYEGYLLPGITPQPIDHYLPKIEEYKRTLPDVHPSG